MTPRRLLLIGVASLALGGAGVGVAGGLQDAPPQAATPAPTPAPAPTPDPIGDALRGAPPVAVPVEPAPAGDPAPAAPIAITPPAIVIGEMVDKTEEAETAEAADKAPAPVVEKPAAPEVPVRRQRRRVAIVQAIDKITAESMRFEVEVGGRPVRFNNALIFTARACEVAAPGELVEDSIAYLDISLQPRGTAKAADPRQIFRGWMFASTPALSGLQHPIYDAWVVGCKA